MTKVDALKALREARYAAQQAQATATVPSAPAKRAPSKAATAATPAPAPVSAATNLCGHRGMGNKSCQRDAGHAEKSHRYK
jgi:hypothetical protein